ncbi:hypothetical protein HNY73_010517 [Argiope bruennichi]|uniref:Uncharacterized protein n=1 Tax=Argiope bruennichi TaxID=94029 RepID=A0A8T0F3P9_ARGBR|nr:hypothetical protein HNY73_010517 [Argiope bruennichi]
MFATLTFVTFICLRISEETENVIDIVKYGHIFWSMYFDKFTDEFYEKGGWNKLKTEANLYEYLPKFILDFNDTLNDLKIIKEASVNYRSFKNAFNYHERIQNKSTRISLLWIEFQIGHHESYIKVPLSYDSSINAYELELLLEDLKLILNPLRCNTDDAKILEKKNGDNTFSTAISNSEILCDSKEVKTNHDVAQIQPLLSRQENKITNKVVRELSNISDGIENLTQSSGITSKTEGLTLNITDKRENFEFYKYPFKGMEIQRQVESIDSTKKLQTEQNISPAVSIKRRSGTNSKTLPNFYDLDQTYINKNNNSIIENFYEEDIEEQDKITKLDSIVSINQMEDIESQRETSPKNLAKSRDLTFQNENANIKNEIRITKEELKMSFHLNREGKSEIAKATDVLSTRQMVAYEMAGKTASENLPALKVFSSTNESINSDDKRNSIRKAWEELKDEQEDPDIRNFLKMILVLNDKEGRKFVLSTLQNKENLKSSRESSNKQKNKSKRKKPRK